MGDVAGRRQRRDPVLALPARAPEPTGCTSRDGPACAGAVRLGQADDAAQVTASQLREVVGRLTMAGHWRPGDPEILIVMDSGYDVAYLSHVLADLPVVLVGRLRSDRVMLRDAGPPAPGRKAGGPAGTAASSPSPSPTPGTSPTSPPPRTPPATARRGDGLGPDAPQTHPPKPTRLLGCRG
ncbi:transposase [Streptomyces sp. NPDC001292]|uniref:transposase n=1 Tax=Streptomyces sp. NPDC001292 TaxID=3364558 RepID=UPI0036CB6954